MRALRRLGLLLLAVPLLAVAAEAALQLGARLVGDRGGSWRPGAAVRVLAVGDSHTYGAGLPAERSYPAQLQALLDERQPGRYSVINLGIPGLSTTQVRERLPLLVSRYRPDVVLVWCGVNNAWNRTAAEGSGGWRAGLDAWLQRSRLYRLARVWRHDRAIERSAAATRDGGLRQEATRERRSGEPERLSFEADGRRVIYEGAPDEVTWTLSHGGVVERIENRHGPRRFDDAMERRAEADYRAMAAWLRRAGVPMVLVTYALDDVEPFDRVNRAMRRVAREQGVMLVESPRALARVPLEAREWLGGAHPNGAIYREIAREAMERLLALENG